MKTIKVLSLGAGVQSTALLLMSCRGELPKLDAAIFADTQWEPRAVYEHLDWLEGEAVAAGIPVHRVTRGNLRETAIELARNESRREGERYASIPLHVLMPDGHAESLRPTILSRQCTHGYKIIPVERCIRQTLLGMKPGQRVPKGVRVEQWFGITWDERQRIKPDPNSFTTFVYPFCSHPTPVSAAWVRPDGRPKFWTRTDCLRWLETTYPTRRVPRSACIACPYRSNEEWRVIRDDPESWADAVAFDREIRAATVAPDASRPELIGTPYVHRSCKPLEEVDLRSDTEQGQTTMWDGVGDNECLGMCGV